MLWFTIWFMVILKIPALYLAYVIWWAVKDPPDAYAVPATVAAGPSPDSGGSEWSRRTRRRARPRGGPHGVPGRRAGVPGAARRAALR